MVRTLLCAVAVASLVLVGCTKKPEGGAAAAPAKATSVVLYVKPNINCPYTAKARAFLKQHSITVVEKDFNQSKAELAEKGKKAGVTADVVPTFELADGRMFVGWDEEGVKAFLGVK
jgi:glutaredoxin